MNDPHPELEPLLEKHDLSWDLFSLKNKHVDPEVHDKRSAIVTELHRGGMTWNRMAEVCGRTTGFIQKYSKAVGNKASLENRRENARRNGSARAGEKKPWLSEMMKDRWEDGLFDFHIGRERSEEVVEALREVWSDPEWKARRSAIQKKLWRESAYRQKLLDFHRSPKERARRSKAQLKRMKEDPSKWTAGNGQYVEVTKCGGCSQIWVRSSYEVAAVEILEADSSVVSYQYEPRLGKPRGVGGNSKFGLRRTSMLSNAEKEKIRSAYLNGTLKVKSLSPEGNVQWKEIEDVHRMETDGERIVRVETDGGSMVLTGGHRVYTSPTEKVEAEDLTRGSMVQGGWSTSAFNLRVRSVSRIPDRRYMYDLTVADNHNLLLENSKTFVSNCPDRNYHFRPPTSEGTINQFNRVFAYVWEDEELIEYMSRGVDTINMWPPETGWNTIDEMVRSKPAWRQMILMSAIAHACMALSLNWIADEFSVVGETGITVILPDDREITLSIEELFELYIEVENEGNL